MTIFVVRHGESVGNDRRIVQGRDFDPGLTETGRRQARRVGFDLCDRVSDDVTVHVSPARRARETAAIIGDVVAAPVTVDDQLVEVDAGVVAGHSKAVLRDRHPERLAVWEARGDLDDIPLAETGDEAQARALAVLDRLGRASGDHVLVAHAAFNRYLVNTARGRRRTAPIGHAPTDWSVVRGEPLDGAESSRLPNGMRGDVRRLQTGAGDYVLKREAGVDATDLAFQSWLSEYVNSKLPVLPDVLAWDVTDGVGRQVLGYESGTHEYGPLSVSRRRRLFDTVSELSVLLQQTHREFDLETLADRLERTVESTPNPAVAALGRRLLQTDVVGGDDRTSWTYVHYDLHRDNLLFDGDEVTILDLGGVCLAPPTFQAASLLTAGFLIEDVSGFDVDESIDRWPAAVDRHRLLVLMVARAYVGLAFFEGRRADRGLTPAELDIRNRYVGAARRLAGEFLGWHVPDGLTVDEECDVVEG